VKIKEEYFMSVIAYSKEYLVELPKSKRNRVAVASLTSENSFLYKNNIYLSNTLVMILNILDKEFKFTFTIGASENKGACSTEYRTVEEELLRDWYGETVFCDLSYHQNCNRWVTKCYEESKKLNTMVVMLVPIMDNNSYLRGIVYNKARQIRFIRSDSKVGSIGNSNTFQAVVVVF
jgi:hypothetical protein